MIVWTPDSLPAESQESFAGWFGRQLEAERFTVLEEAAKLCDSLAAELDDGAFDHAATAIRRLKLKPPEGT